MRKFGAKLIFLLLMNSASLHATENIVSGSLPSAGRRSEHDDQRLGSETPAPRDAPFSAQLILSLDRARAVQDYMTLGVMPQSADRMTTKDSMGALYLLKGCQTDEEGNCNVTARSQIVRRDGSLFSVMVPSWKADDPTLIPVLVGKKREKIGTAKAYGLGSIDFTLMKMTGVFDPSRWSGDYLFMTTFIDNNTPDKRQLVIWAVARVDPSESDQAAYQSCKPMLKMGHRLSSPSDDNSYGYELLYRKRDVRGAIAIFACNAAMHPELASSLFDSLGEAYVAQGDREKAIDAYRKATKGGSLSKNSRAEKTLRTLTSSPAVSASLKAAFRQAYLQGPKVGANKQR